MRSKTKKTRKNFWQQELSGWKLWEIIWLLATCAVIIAVSVVGGDSLLGMISAVTGVANVVCTGKGKLSAFGFGVINSILYAMISFQAQLYGETMLNVLYYLPMQFVGFWMWSKHMNQDTNEVEKKCMNWNKRVVLVGSIVFGTLLYGFFLQYIGDQLPYIDAFTTVSSVIALILSVKMYAEQWWVWLIVDGISVYMWWKDFSSGSDNIATLFMWIMFVMNAVLMLIRWEKEAKPKSYKA